MEISIARLSEIYLELQKKGAHNINLVTPTHYAPQIAESLRISKNDGLNIPIVYNCGGYESVNTLRLLEGLIDIYLPDSKYFSGDLAKRLSGAPDYPEINITALKEMYRQVGPCQFDQNGLIKRGMIVRHLILPEQTLDSKRVIRRLYETFGDNIYISIMNQYTPLPHVADIPALNRALTKEEYHRVIVFCKRLGIQNAYIQEGETASESFIPPFTYEGLLPL
jgi:putative pyruvate formate lyase activating enzyme